MLKVIVFLLVMLHLMEVLLIMMHFGIEVQMLLLLKIMPSLPQALTLIYKYIMMVMMDILITTQGIFLLEIM